MADHNLNPWWRNPWQMILFILTYIYVNRWTFWNHLWHAISYANAYDEPSKFKVYIYEDEVERIRAWTREYDHIETGGDLFGLWQDKNTVVIQLVLGPGKNCRRTATSFYQDIKYLEKAGSEITKKHGLCNVGQWHSHHRLHLPKPSAGDETTVWGNMPDLGMKRYIVFIATISGDSQKPHVQINPFLFENESESERGEIIPGIYEVLSTSSPLRQNEDLTRKLEEGAECQQTVSVTVMNKA